jgi:hypothetical protein
MASMGAAFAGDELLQGVTDVLNELQTSHSSELDQTIYPLRSV